MEVVLGHIGARRNNMLAHLRRDWVRHKISNCKVDIGLLSAVRDNGLDKISNQCQIRLLPPDVVLACTDISNP